MNKIIFPLALTLMACQYQQTLQLQNTQIASRLPKVSDKQTITSEYLISANGIGEAKLGMTLGQLKKIADRDTEFNPISTFASDLNAIAVVEQGMVQYYILFDADSDSEAKFNPTDNALITSLVTNNYNYQTKEGIKVGMLIQEAEDICGNAILSYNIDGESGEYISFDDYDPDNISFRASYFKLISNGLGFSGIYPEYPGVVYTTDKYQNDAAIAAIEVSCKKDACEE